MNARRIPTFSSEDEEHEFWADHDSADFVDWDSAEPTVLPNLKPTMVNISLRLPTPMLHELKLLANKRDIAYSALLKQFLAERLDQELRHIDTAPTGVATDK